jgi:Tfp pilus assembly protein PilF
MKMPAKCATLAESPPGAAPLGFKGAVFDFRRFIVRRKAPAAAHMSTGTAPSRTQLYRAPHALALLVSVIVVVACAGCHPNSDLPDKSSKVYADVVSAFYIGLAALQVGDDVHAESKLSQVTQLVPAEPAGWANWGVLALRQRNLDAAAQRFERARFLAPQNDHIYDLLGALESSRGHSAEAIANWRKATEINPKNYRAAYNLAEEIERQGGPNADADFQDLIQKILAAQPNNLAAFLELSRVAAKRGDTSTLQSTIAKIGQHSAAWPPEVQQQLPAQILAPPRHERHSSVTR